MLNKRIYDNYLTGERILLDEESFSICGFVEHFPEAQKVWEISHNKNSLNVIMQVHDESGTVIQPDKIDITENTISVTFKSNVAGKLLFVVKDASGECSPI